MSVYCKGLCCREDIPVKAKFSGNHYRQGVKYCRTCSRWMRIDTIQCPCCKNMTSSKCRNNWRKKRREKLACHVIKYPKVAIVAV